MEIMKRFICTIVFSLSVLGAVYAQQLTVKGTVTEEGTKSPIGGASVIVKGTQHGTSTDMDGHFTLANVPSGAVLVVSYIGMHTQEVKVGGRTTLNITLKEDTQELKEVVVIGYGTTQKRDLTGSIVSLKTDEFADRPSTNPLASIQGKVAGVQIVNTGRAGQDPEIRIRGTNSINGYTPLYVVDGLFTDNINYLNPQDIESMEILKDPSSLAIFGVRGANGVIIISTKKAKKGTTMVNINSSLGFKTIYDRIKMANGDEFRELFKEELASREDVDNRYFDFSKWTANTDWQDEIFRKAAWVTNHNISIASSNEKSKFYLGAGYTEEEGSIKHEKLSKTTLSVSSDYNLTDYLRLGFQANGSRTLPADAKGVAGALKAAPIAEPYDSATGLLNYLPNFQGTQVGNPLIDIEKLANHNKAVNHRLAGNVYGELDILKDLTFKATLSMDYRVGESRAYTPIIWVFNRDTNKRINTNEQESISQSKSTTMATQQDYILTYKKIFDKHNLTLMTGLTSNYLEHTSLNGSRQQKMEDIIFSIPDENDSKWWLSSIGNESGAKNGSGQYRRFTMSYLFRALYNYDNRYLVNASFRRDGASVFHNLGNTWDNFYSFGAGWVVSEEAFMKQQKAISYLKLKGSWGLLGNQNTPNNYPTYPILQSSGSAVFGDRIITGYAPKYLVQNLGWEKTYAWEAGAEIRFLNNRLSIEPVYYRKNTKDLIVELASFAGAKNSLQNLGEIENKGWELSASWNDKAKDSDFSYSFSGNLTTIKNTVLSLGRGKDDALYNGTKGISRTLEGHPIGHFYGYKVIGVYQNNDDISNSPKNTLTDVLPGDLKFADINGDGKITPADRTEIGNPTPDFTYGFNVSLAYKGFDLTADFMGVYGNEIYRGWGESEYAILNYQAHRMGRWRGAGTSNWEPVIDNSRAINRMNSNYYIEDGSFFRFRNLQIGYSLPQQVLERLKVKKIRVYANAQNIKTWHKNTGYTPEIGGSALAFGIDGGTYPMPMILTYGINLTF